MTYILATNFGASAFILADARVTFSQSGVTIGKNSALKTAAVRDDCIIAVAGHVENGRRFIDGLITVIDSSVYEGAVEPYRNFAHATDRTNQEDERFWVIVGLHTGDQVYMTLFDSELGLVQEVPKGTIVSLGSGKRILDPRVKKFISEYDQTFALEDTVGYTLAPDFLCFRLNLIANSVERLILEKAGVGGFFHYVYLNPGEAGTQNPAVTLIARIDSTRKVVTFEQHRVASYLGALVYESFVMPDGPLPQTANLPPGHPDRKSSEKIAGKTRTEIIWDTLRGPVPEWAARKRIDIKEIHSQPYYRFFGAGFPDLEQSDFYLAEGSLTSEPIADRNGNIKDSIFRWANGVLAKLG